MKRPFFKLETVILAVGGVVVVYLLSILLDFRVELILGLFLLSISATLWMVFKILKDPYSTEKTFDDYFYQDRDDLGPTKDIKEAKPV